MGKENKLLTYNQDAANRTSQRIQSQGSFKDQSILGAYGVMDEEAWRALGEMMAASGSYIKRKAAERMGIISDKVKGK